MDPTPMTSSASLTKTTARRDVDEEDDTITATSSDALVEVQPTTTTTTGRTKEWTAVPCWYDDGEGRRHVAPYYFTFHVAAKGRWVGRSLSDVFNQEFPHHDAQYYREAVRQGRLRCDTPLTKGAAAAAAVERSPTTGHPRPAALEEAETKSAEGSNDDDCGGGEALFAAASSKLIGKQDIIWHTVHRHELSVFSDSIVRVESVHVLSSTTRASSNTNKNKKPGSSSSSSSSRPPMVRSPMSLDLLIAVTKPSSLPTHSSGRYHYNSCLAVLQHNLADVVVRERRIRHARRLGASSGNTSSSVDDAEGTNTTTGSIKKRLLAPHEMVDVQGLTDAELELLEQWVMQNVIARGDGGATAAPNDADGSALQTHRYEDLLVRLRSSQHRSSTKQQKKQEASRRRRQQQHECPVEGEEEKEGVVRSQTTAGFSNAAVGRASLDNEENCGPHQRYVLPELRACHRLDKSTSGLLLLATSNRGAQMVGDMLAEKSNTIAQHITVPSSHPSSTSSLSSSVSALATLLESEGATDTFDVMKHYLAKVAGRFPSSYDDDDADDVDQAGTTQHSQKQQQLTPLPPRPPRRRVLDWDRLTRVEWLRTPRPIPAALWRLHKASHVVVPQGSEDGTHMLSATSSSSLPSSTAPCCRAPTLDVLVTEDIRVARPWKKSPKRTRDDDEEQRQRNDDGSNITREAEEDGRRGGPPTSVSSADLRHDGFDNDAATKKKRSNAASGGPHLSNEVAAMTAAEESEAHPHDDVARRGAEEGPADGKGEDTKESVLFDSWPAATLMGRLWYNAADDTSVVLCTPLTGRTHQIRQHLQYLNFPIANDTKYNPRFREQTQRERSQVHKSVVARDDDDDDDDDKKRLEDQNVYFRFESLPDAVQRVCEADVPLCPECMGQLPVTKCGDEESELMLHAWAYEVRLEKQQQPLTEPQPQQMRAEGKEELPPGVMAEEDKDDREPVTDHSSLLSTPIANVEDDRREGPAIVRRTVLLSKAPEWSNPPDDLKQPTKM